MHKLNPIFRNIVLFSIVSISILLVWTTFNYPSNSSDSSQKTTSNSLVKQRSTSSPHASKESKKARADYFKKIYKDPKTGEIPRGAGLIDLEIAKSIDANSTVKKNELNLNWSHAGPSNVGGRTRAIASDNRNTSILIAGAVAGGIWKSDNSGQSWRQVANTNLMPSITSIAQDPRAGFEDTWYAVGGENDGSSVFSFIDSGSHYNTGYLVSKDNGNTWEFKSLQVSPNSQYDWGLFGLTNRIVVHPTTGDLFVATNGFGVYKIASSDEALNATLANQINPGYSDIGVNSNGVLLQYLSGRAAGQQDYTPGFKISWDNGTTWSQINVSGQDFSTIERGVIEFSYSDPNTAYALFQDDAGVLDNGVDEVMLYRLLLDANNQTVTVEDVSGFLPDGIAANDEANNIRAFNPQGNYNMALAVHPSDPNMVFVCLTNIYRIRNINAPTDFSTETALKDVLIGGYGVDTFFYENQHPDQHLLYFPDPVNNPNYAISANDGGLYSVPDITLNGALTWTDIHSGYNATQFYHASISPRAGHDQFVAGAQDNGTPYVLIDHPTQAELSLGDLSTGDGSFSYTGEDYVYVSSQNGYISKYFLEQDKSEEGVDYSGFSYTSYDFNYLGEVTNRTVPNEFGRSFIHPFTVDRATHDVMYYAANEQGGASYNVYRNTQIKDDNADLLTTWEALPGFSSFAEVTALSTSTVPAGRLLLGVSGYNIEGQVISKVVVVDDAKGISPTFSDKPIVDPTTSQAIEGNIRHIAINPEDANEYIVVLSNYNVVSLFHTSDNGANFTVIEGNLAGDETVRGEVFGLSIRTASILPTNGKTLYLVGTSAGLYATTILDGNNTEWDKESPNLIANLPITWIESRPSDGMILVATHGQGAFWTKVGVTTSIASSNEIPFEVELSPNYPNPFNPETTIGFSMNQASDVLLEVFNSNGQLVSTILNSKLSAGKHSYQFNARNLNSGVYFARLTTNNTVKTQKMTLLK
jgi:hypothetical protein